LFELTCGKKIHDAFAKNVRAHGHFTIASPPFGCRANQNSHPGLAGLA
jgi:hypothetical protein